MFMSALWDTIFMLADTYREASVFLIDNHLPALRFGNTGTPVTFAHRISPISRTGALARILYALLA